MDVGTVAHAIILERKDIDDVIVRQPADIKVRRGKAWDAFLKDSDPKMIILKEADWLKVNGIHDAHTVPEY